MMSATTHVDFHVHSVHSDGVLSPEEVAAQLASAGVVYAALTDHDTVEGVQTFQRAARQRGMGTVTGVEMTVTLDGEEAHLLAYGFDPDHPELLEALAAARQGRPARSHRTSVHTASETRANASEDGANRTNGRLDIRAAIDLIHDAGGRAFLAHPLVLAPDPERLRELLEDLARAGLDGVEAFYGPYTQVQQERLFALAEDLGLLAVGGSDLHEMRRGRDGPGVQVTTDQWKSFRDAVAEGGGAGSSGDTGTLETPRLHPKGRHFLLHVVLPTVLAITLFVGALFGLVLPAFEESLLERKREMIRELTHSAISIVEAYHRDARAGELSLREAQRLAADRIEHLRYGPEGKDYFWIQDMQPKIIMHPYVQELEGRDVSDYTDPRGTRIFVEFARVVREQGGGYVDYVWQWKDDPERVAPKQSYVQGFEPWGWIVGTGLYTEDVRAEISQIKGNLLRASGAIVAVVALLLLWSLRASLRVERRRAEAEEGLRASTARYRSLVEATTEGVLLIERDGAQHGRCRYANAMLLDLLGATQEQMSLLDLEDVLPRVAENEEAWDGIEAAWKREAGPDETAPGGFEGVLRKRDGTLVECAIAINRMVLDEHNALILLVKPVAGPEAEGESQQARLATLGEVGEAVPPGLTRVRATPRGTVVEATDSARRLLRMAQDNEQPLRLPPVLGSDEGWQELLDEAEEMGHAERRVHLSGASGRIAIDLSATLVRNEAGRAKFLDCLLEDVTHQEQREAEREALVRRLQGAMLFLHEPVSAAQSPAVFCAIDDSVISVVRRMTASKSTVTLVRSDDREVVGVFTDRDLRKRVIAAGLDLQTPVGRVMTAPVASVPDHAEIYQALVEMEERGVQHLAVRDRSGDITGVVRHRELLQFPSYGPIVLAREIAHAENAEEVIAAARRAPGLAEALTETNAPPERVTRMLTSVCDAACVRFIELARQELGPAPVQFCFLGLGSHGREELTPGSDQDNALIYDDEGAEDELVAEYFLELGRRVCGWLDEAGFPYCRGEIMAQNPRWSQPLSVWKDYFSEWIRRAEPMEVLEFVAFFDFRAVHGDRKLSDALREHVFDQAETHPAFFAQLGQHVTQFKPPVQLFGRIIAGGSQGGNVQMLNIKDTMAPITGFARVYALQQRIDGPNTVERLNGLAEVGALADATQEETSAAFTNLMRLRLQRQTEALQAGDPPDNLVAWRTLDEVERTLVSQAFAQIEALQKRIRHDLLGAT